MRFLEVVGDSRCPGDALCITGGDAIVRIVAEGTFYEPLAGQTETAGQGTGNIGVGFAIPSNKAKDVAELMAGLTAYPRYYAHMAPINMSGPTPLDLTPPAELDAEQLFDFFDPKRPFRWLTCWRRLSRAPPVADRST